MKTFDYIIIGSGQAGTPLAFHLAEKGRVAFIEKDKPGGTCVNTGCTPTKAYIASARKIWDAKNAVEWGIEVPEGTKANLAKVKERKDELIQDSRDGIENGVKNNEQIQWFQGTARFISNYEVEINGEIITAKLIFINVGARPKIPDAFRGIPYLTNESLLDLNEIPEKLLIVGGSYIGLEFGQMFQRFGSKVTIIEKENRLIYREDAETSKVIGNFLKAEGIEIVLDANCIGGSKNGEDSITVTTKCPGHESVTGSHVLLALGRMPNTDTLHLGNTTIEMNPQGYIEVNDYCETNVPGIFALGDCNGKGAFTHTSYNDFQIVAGYMDGDKKRKISDRITTYGLFTDPPLGRVGLTKKQALEQGFKILVAYRPMDKIARAKEKGETYGFMELIIDAKTDQFLGGCILGVGGDEIINGITNLMYAKQPYTVFRDSVQIHPTVTELIPTILENLKPLPGQ